MFGGLSMKDSPRGSPASAPARAPAPSAFSFMSGKDGGDDEKVSLAGMLVQTDGETGVDGIIRHPRIQ